MHRTSIRVAITVTAMAFFAGCGGDPAGPPVPKPAPKLWVNPTPQVFAASPAELAVGEELIVLGNQFITPAKGKVELRLTGTFFADDGAQFPVSLQKKVTHRAQTEIRWRLYPDIVFHPNGDRLGKFVGQLHVVNQAFDGSLKPSAAYPVTITIKPSLIPRLITPLNASCAKPVLLDTLDNQPMAFSVEAIGFRPGTADEPLRFFWTFLGNQWDVGTTNGILNSDTIYKESTPVMLIDSVRTGLTSSVEDGGTAHFVVQLAQDVLGSDGIKKLRTRPLPDGTNSAATSVNVAVVDPTGKTANLVMPLGIHRRADLQYDGNEHEVQRYPAQQVTDCIPGGNIGREVSYHETTSESRSLSLGFNYNAELGSTWGLPSNPFALGLNFSLGFGKNVNDTVSSEESITENISAQVLPGHFAACYRQTTKIHRIAQITGWNACGDAINLGDAILTDWVFSFDVAMARTCVPSSTLPPGTN